MSFKTSIAVAVTTVVVLHHYKLDTRLANAITPPPHAAPGYYQKASSWHEPSGIGALSAGGFEHCPQFFFKGIPLAIANAEHLKPRALCYDAFAVYHSGVTHTPIFVAEHLTKSHLVDAKEETRTNRFFADARLPSAERAELEDYHASGYDRGHMAPAGDMPTAQAMAQSFSLANMVPQAPENNRGVWAKSVEKVVRQYVMRTGDDVYVITGPVFSRGRTADEAMKRVSCRYGFH